MTSQTPEASWQEQVAAAREAAQRRQPSVNVGRALAVLAGAFLLGLVVFFIGLTTGVRGDDVTMLGLAVLTFLLASLPFAVNQGLPRQQRHIFIALVSLILIGRYVLSVFTIYLPAEGPIDSPGMAHTNLLPPDIIVGQLMALLAFSVLFAGYSLPVGRLLADRLPRPRIDWPASTIITMSLIMMAIGWPLRIAGGLGMIPAELGWGFLGTLARGTIYCNAILTLAWLRHRSLLAAALLLVNVLAGAATGLLQTSKTEVIIRPMIVVMTWILVQRTIRLRWIAAGVLAIALVYPASEFLRNQSALSGSQFFRNPIQTLGSIASYASSWEWDEWLGVGLESTTRRVDSLGAASVLIRDTPRVSPFQHGATLRLFFLAFVPRILWPEKPSIGIGQWVTEVYGTGPGFEFSTAPTQIGELYFNFGVAGVVAGMAILGMIIRLAHEALLWRGGTAASILALTVIVYYFTISFDSSIGQAYSMIVFAIVPVAVAQVLARAFLTTYPRKFDDAEPGTD